MPYEPHIRGLGLNTVLTSFAVVMLAIVGFMSKHIYEDTEQTHDAVITINATMVKQAELQQVRAQMSELQQKQGELQQKQGELQQKQSELQRAQDQMSLDIKRMSRRP